MIEGWRRIAAAAAVEEAKLRAALRDPDAAQEALLRDILAAAAGTAFGREHGFAGMGPAEFARGVPPRGYDAFRPYVERCADGEPDVLCGEPLLGFDETGGSSGGSKLVPVTAGSLAGFRAAVLPWLADLARAHPAAAAGPVYAAISPACRAPRTAPCGLPIGQAQDAAYLGEEAGAALMGMLAVPPSVAAVRDPAEWAVLTAAHLASRADLAFASVWSPSFLAMLLDAVETECDAVLGLLEGGAPGLPAAPARAEALRAALGSGVPVAYRLWPALAVVSAWADGPSAGYAAALAHRLPQARLQPKGLLATEGAVTLPYGGRLVPALTSTVLEFVDGAGAVAGCRALEVGGTYRVLMTTRGGLYRYDIGDQVLCTGMADGVPDLAFAGRAGTASDLVGEKLTEAFVAACLAPVAGFAALVPEPHRPGYALVSEEGRDGGAARVEEALRRNPQYGYARDIGQLRPLRAVGSPGGARAYAAWHLARGMRLGDIKPPRLVTDAAAAARAWPELGWDAARGAGGFR